METDAPAEPGIASTIRAAAQDEPLKRIRSDLANQTAQTFDITGRELHVAGWIFGPDRPNGVSPFGNGSDEVVAVAVLLRTAGQLVSGSATLFSTGNTYAAAALVRQLVEVEYLAWAFDTRDGDAERWLRSDKAERMDFFQPRKLRKAAQGHFRSKDYGYHCEYGGHPVPDARKLLNDDGTVAQIFLADMLGHSGRAWDHLVSWADDKPHGEVILRRHQALLDAHTAWKSSDPLAHLPSPS